MSKTKIFAHRGASGYAPENTLEAFALAITQGADGIELDVQLTKDGIPVVIHDETIDRVTEKKGWVKDYTLKKLKELTVLKNKFPEYSAAKIPTLEEVLDAVKASGIQVNIELKTGIYWYPEIEQKVADLVKKAGMEEKEAEERIEYLLNKVGMSKADMDKFPYEFSGGQRQRIGIARALSVNPEFIVCDEPIAALDVSIQAQVVNMLEDLQNEFGLTYLFAAHDLSMVRYISTRIGVMYLGTLVEVAESNELYTNPMHPYTKALLSAIPIVDPLKAREHKRIQLKGELPSPMNIPEGCRFVTRCPYATKACKNGVPKLQEISKGHSVACHRAKEIL